MSFLDVKIPAVTIDSLIDDIRKQVEFGRLNTFPLATEYVRNTTPELDRLTRILQKEFKEPSLRPMLTQVASNQELSLVDDIDADDGCYVLCIQKNKAGGAVWTDLVRKHELDGNTILKCGEGSLKAETGKGGIYLMFVLD